MFKLRCTIDCPPRTKNGQPPQATTGVASANCSHTNTCGGIQAKASWRTISPIDNASSGAESTAPTQNRRVMEASSGLASSSALLTTRGSSSIPQIGQLPGCERTICGCMGQVYSVAAAGRGPVRPARSAMPHFGQLPGPSCRTSGCIGQV